MRDLIHVTWFNRVRGSTEGQLCYRCTPSDDQPYQTVQQKCSLQENATDCRSCLSHRMQGKETAPEGW